MTEACLDEAVENMFIWLNLQPHLPHVKDLRLLKSYIIGCRSIEVAKEKINKYFMARINFASEISNRNIMNIQWDNMHPVAYLPDLTPEGYVVLFFSLPDLADVPRFDFLQSIRFITMMFEHVLRERPYMTGHIFLVDLKNLSLKLVPKFPMTLCANIVHLIENVYPFVMKAIYNFNTPQIAHTLQQTLLKPVISDGIYNSIVSYRQDASILEKHIPIEILPQDYGGKAPKLKDIMHDWRVKLENSKDVFSTEYSLLPDKSRIPKQMLESSNFGSSGTFRKLNID